MTYIHALNKSIPVLLEYFPTNENKWKTRKSSKPSQHNELRVLSFHFNNFPQT